MTYYSITFLSRMLTVINVHVDLKGDSTECTYEVKPYSLLMVQYPNMVNIPVINIPPMWTVAIVPFVVINLSTESTFLSKHEVLGLFDQTDTEICETMTSWVLEPLALEVASEGLENPLPYRKGQFICSPADISVYRKVDLQDAEVSEKIQERF